MALTLTIAGVDRTVYLAYDSMTLKFNTVDFTLVGTTAALGSVGANLGTDAVVIADPIAGISFTGTMMARKRIKRNRLKDGNISLVMTATNTTAVPARTAPFDLSDVAAGGNLLQEDGFRLLLEDGSGYYLLQNTASTNWQDLSIDEQWVVAEGSGPVYGEVTVFKDGLRTGDTFTLIVSDFSISQPYLIQLVTVTWPSGVPVYQVQFGLSGAYTTWRILYPHA